MATNWCRKYAFKTITSFQNNPSCYFVFSLAFKCVFMQGFRDWKWSKDENAKNNKRKKFLNLESTIIYKLYSIDEKKKKSLKATKSLGDSLEKI